MGGRDRPEPAQILTRPEVPRIVVIYRRAVRLILPALARVADRAQQMCGGLGVSTELPVAKIAREVRPFRIYDGPSEVHRWSIAKRAVRAITAEQDA